MVERATHFSRFDRLSTRYRIEGLLVSETGLRIGAGKSVDVATSDQPVIRDSLNRLFLPGSSLKGVLRSGLEAVLRGLDDDRLPACDPFLGLCTQDLAERAKKARKPIELDDVLREICVVCGLFGSPHLAGRVFVADLPLAENALSRTEVRDGVGIDRDRRVAQMSPAVSSITRLCRPARCSSSSCSWRTWTTWCSSVWFQGPRAPRHRRGPPRRPHEPWSRPRLPR